MVVRKHWTGFITGFNGLFTPVYVKRLCTDTTDLWIYWIIYWIYLDVYFWFTTPPLSGLIDIWKPWTGFTTWLPTDTLA